MRFAIILFVALLISSICNAQFLFKIDAGYSYNHLITYVSNRTFTKNVNKIGYNAALRFKYEVNKLIGFETGISWIQKNYSFKRTENYSGIFDKFTNNYLQIPFTVPIRIYEKKKIQIFLNNGVFASYLISTRVNGVMPNAFNSTNELDVDGQSIQNFNLTTYSEDYKFNTMKDNRFEFGLQTGITFQYDFNEKTVFFLEYRFYQSLTDIQKEYMVNQASKINQTSIVSVGFILKFNPKINRSIL